jgi:Ribosome biogenesis protein SLX9
VANLESLANALPDDGDPATAVDAGARSRGTTLREQANVNVIQRKSIKSRPGAMKRREKVDNEERERFAKNLAEMSGKKMEGRGEDSAKLENGRVAHDRWAALRGFIAQTMEQRPELKELKS